MLNCKQLTMTKNLKKYIYSLRAPENQTAKYPTSKPKEKKSNKNHG